jgi:hypothetical protein
MQLPKSDFICLIIMGIDLEDGTRHFFNEDLGWGCEEHQSYPYFPPKHPEWARRYACPPLPSGHKWERRVVAFDITAKRLVHDDLLSPEAS